MNESPIGTMAHSFEEACQMQEMTVEEGVKKLISNLSKNEIIFLQDRNYLKLLLAYSIFNIELFTLIKDDRLLKGVKEEEAFYKDLLDGKTLVEASINNPDALFQSRNNFAMFGINYFQKEDEILRDDEILKVNSVVSGLEYLYSNTPFIREEGTVKTDAFNSAMPKAEEYDRLYPD